LEPLVIHRNNPNDGAEEISSTLPFDSTAAWLILQEDFSTEYVTFIILLL
jgi:hypothetical protein